MKIEFLICSKNDNYCGDPMHRLRTSLKHNINILQSYEEWSITVIDWASTVPIKDIINVQHKNLKHLYISQEIANSVHSKFSEVHALNYAARISDAQYIGRLDQDTMIGPNFIKWFFTDKSSSADTFYLCKRADLVPDVEHIEGESKPNAGLQWDAWGCAIGIFLIPKHMWVESTGYDESYIHFNNMEIEYAQRLKQRYNYNDLTPTIGYDFYHIHHDRLPDSERTFNPIPDPSRLVFHANNSTTWGLQSFQDLLIKTT